MHTLPAPARHPWWYAHNWLAPLTIPCPRRMYQGTVSATVLPAFLGTGFPYPPHPRPSGPLRVSPPPGLAPLHVHPPLLPPFYAYPPPHTHAPARARNHCPPAASVVTCGVFQPAPTSHA